MSEYDFHFLNYERVDPSKKPLKFRQTDFSEIYQQFSNNNASQQAGRCLECGNPYCEWKCPVHNYIPNWLTLLRDNRIFDAAALCHETNTLPEICGRICPQDRLCEGACTLHDDFGAVTIGSAEKYIVDTAFSMGWLPDMSNVPLRDEKVAIVGAGPAGLGCANFLRKQGVSSVVYDRYPEIGGLMTFGIPEFKLEKRIVLRRQGIFERLGIEFKLNTEVGKDVSIEQLLAEYDAVFLATGCESAVRDILPGEELENVSIAMPYLVGKTVKLHNFDWNVDEIDLKGKDVVVLGGGDTGMDCNRTAIRQGAKSVKCIYRRDAENMPGSRKEVQHCREEGVEFIFQSQPLELIGNESGSVTGVKVIATEKDDAEPSSDRVSFSPVPGTEQIINCDYALISFGFVSSTPQWCTNIGILTTQNGLIDVNVDEKKANEARLAFQTSNPKVFAGGDNVLGADLVVTAVDAGQRAAASIVRSFDHIRIQTI